MKRNLKNILLFLLVILFTACASSGHKMLTDFLEKGIDTLTYDEAVERWHEPEKITQGKETFTAVWVDEDYYLIDTPGSAFRAPTLTGRLTILTFDNKTKKLEKYEIEYY